MQNSNSWDFKCSGLDNHMLPLEGVSWGSDEFQNANMDNFFGPPYHPPPQKPLPPLPRAQSLSSLLDDAFSGQTLDISLRDPTWDTYHEARHYLSDIHQSKIPNEAKPVIPLLLDVLDGFSYEVNPAGSLMKPDEEKPATFSVGSGSITIGLDPALSKPIRKISKMTGTVLVPSSHFNIPEAYDHCTPCETMEHVESIYSPESTSTLVSSERASQVSLEEKTQISTSSRHRDVWKMLPHQAAKNVLPRIPEKASKVLGLREPKKSKRGIHFMFRH